MPSYSISILSLSMPRNEQLKPSKNTSETNLKHLVNLHIAGPHNAKHRIMHVNYHINIFANMIIQANSHHISNFASKICHVMVALIINICFTFFFK
ncbi:hypothetical protein NC653_038694 [Populus alba x Populus x berolinensis]|uniref:Uncharacterized protein n=1 Tax=Populus alba x Populus x berolinensis TaxID=444605 RepID=A0AAD6PTN4_9ROSI|nr:hypothetical protein NC653_038694 [Populus alba x Populus x berolinensis]